jgi:AraC-like DNA-binding protein
MITAGASRVASGLLCVHAVAITPASSMELVRSSSPSTAAFPVKKSGRLPCNCFFGACLAFTHVTACTLAESPSDPFHRKLRQLRCLSRRFDCYRVERTSSRAGVSPAEVQRLSRRTVTSTTFSYAGPLGEQLQSILHWVLGHHQTRIESAKS